MPWTRAISRSNTVRVVAAVVIGVVVAGTVRAQTISSPVWTVPEVGALPDDDHGRLVRRGRDLITATYAHIGPEVPNSAKRFAGNNLA
jgi:thiosulfate dehydrogenase